MLFCYPSGLLGTQKWHMAQTITEYSLFMLDALPYKINAKIGAVINRYPI